MTIPGELDLKDWFAAEVQDYLCVTPTSTSPQPVHVLNGFLHNTLSGTRKPRGPVSLAATKQGGLFADSRGDVRARLSGVEFPATEREFDRVRHAISSLIATDRAVFKSFHSFQLAHLGLVTSDSTHLGIGKLCSRLAFRGETTSEVLHKMIVRLREEQANPHWQVQAVLVDENVTDDWEPQPPEEMAWWGDNAKCEQLADDLEGLLRRSMALVAISDDSLLPLQVLARTATLVGLLTYALVPSRLCDRVLPTLLLEAGPPGSDEMIRDTSHQHLEEVHAGFSDWVAQKLDITLQNDYQIEGFDDAKAKTFLTDNWKHTGLAGGIKEASIKSSLGSVYDAWRTDPAITVRQATSSALRDAMQAATGDKPRKWFEGVGRNCGFIGPRRGPVPRVRAEVALIPTILLAGLSEEDGHKVPLSLVLERLWERFGLAFGQSYGEVSLPESNLESNLSAFKLTLTSLGLAHTYSDGVTEVLNPLKNWTPA